MCRSQLLLFIAAVTMVCRVVCAQHTDVKSPQVKSSSVAPMQLPILVDGSKTPDQIPDSLAYQHFFMAVSAHPSPSAQEQARQAAQLLPIQLCAADQQALVSALANFRTQLDQIESALSQATSAPASASRSSQIASLWAQSAALVSTTRATVQQYLTSDGAALLDQHVKTRVKAHIVIYGGPM
jgi:hypothetical protein